VFAVKGEVTDYVDLYGLWLCGVMVRPTSVVKAAPQKLL
jgi:hypothetical protein